MSNDEFTDWYEILKIYPLVTVKEIELAYRMRMQEAHPDKNPSPDAHEKTKLINAAKEVLLDENKRAVFDCERAGRRKNARRNSQSASTDPRGITWMLKALDLEQKLQSERSLRMQAESRAKSAQYQANLVKFQLREAEEELQRTNRINRWLQQSQQEAEQRAGLAEASATSDYQCRRQYSHCKACPESYSHGYSYPYECLNLEHCRVCIDLQREFQGYDWI